jgi:hypothetical protein
MYSWKFFKIKLAANGKSFPEMIVGNHVGAFISSLKNCGVRFINF